MVDVAVIGAGVMGSATARALARRGESVVLFERYEIEHKRGSSHGSSRIFRFSYPDATYVRMAQEALSLWRDLEAETGESLLTKTGGIDIGESVGENHDALKACGADTEMLAPQQLRKRFPSFNPPEDRPLLYSPDSAVVAAERAWGSFARSAVAHGAELRENSAVTEFEVGDEVTIRTDDVEVRAGTVVVTAGAWARPLLRQVGIDVPVRPTRETVAFFRLPEALPPVVVEWGEPTIYCLAAPGDGLKVGEHIAGPTADPDEDGAPDFASVERLRAWITDRFPTASPDPHRAETCFYTNTSDESFVLERHGPVVVGSPCSGHGFKFAPLMGERLADLAIEESL